METTTIAIILAIITFLGILLTAFFSDILKEGTGKLYSFHKFQLWIWTLIIIPCFILNWGFINPSKPTLTVTELILLGISGSTIITAEIINRVHLNSPLNGGMLKMLNTNSKGFWVDILTDDHGELSIPRLQQLMFTVTYVAIYISMFFPEKIYPAFDDYAYVLMGISTGTFLIGKGLKK